MLGILANFGEDASEKAIDSIISGIQSISNGDFADSRYFKQLRILVQLRTSIGQQFEKAMQSVSTFFKEENDYLYRKGEIKGAISGEQRGEIIGERRGEITGERRGEIKGEEKARRAFVENLIVKLAFSDEQVVEATEVSIDFVQKVRAELQDQ
jgi:predicted transposase YdaD